MTRAITLSWDSWTLKALDTTLWLIEMIGFYKKHNGEINVGMGPIYIWAYLISWTEKKWENMQRWSSRQVLCLNLWLFKNLSLFPLGLLVLRKKLPVGDNVEIQFIARTTLELDIHYSELFALWLWGDDSTNL